VIAGPQPKATGSMDPIGVEGGPALASPRSRTRRFGVRNVGFPIIAFGLFIGIWYLFSEVVMAPERRFLVPPPHEVWKVAIATAVNRNELLQGLWGTTKVSVVGLAVAIALGVAVALVMSQARWLEQSLFPYAILLQVVPILAIVPLIGLILGFGFLARVIVVAIFSLWPIINNTLFGLKSADPDMHSLFTLKRASRWSRFFKLQFPAALPAMFQGFRIGAGAAVIGAIVGEFFFRRGEAGLGILLDRYRAQLRTPELYGAIFFSVILGVVVFWFFGFLANRLTGKWYVPYDEGESA
jgi:NitT/TauT family transport system permease protein